MKSMSCPSSLRWFARLSLIALFLSFAPVSGSYMKAAHADLSASGSVSRPTKYGAETPEVAVRDFCKYLVQGDIIKMMQMTDEWLKLSASKRNMIRLAMRMPKVRDEVKKSMTEQKISMEVISIEPIRGDSTAAKVKISYLNNDGKRMQKEEPIKLIKLRGKWFVTGDSKISINPSEGTTKQRSGK